ncbi:hypothetical protein [Citrobacter braakii]|uniref:hypothetical protein n=1 Tax=Citrobacter braakii TaxID=57706 RepID=UPI003A5233CE
MSENNYGALMLKSALDTSVDVTKIIAPGIYPVIAGNASVPDSSAGLMTVVLTATSQKTTFQKESSSVVYSLINGKWKKPEPGDVGNFGTAAFCDVTTSITDDATGRVLTVGYQGIGGNAGPLTNGDFNQLSPSGFINGQTNGPNNPTLYMGFNVRHADAYQFTLVGRQQRYFAQCCEAGAFKGWDEFYTTAHKPTAADVGALPITGGTINGALGIGTANGLGGHSIVLGDSDTGFKQEGDGILNVYANSAHVFRFISSLIESMKPLKVNGNCIATGEMQAGNGSARMSSDGNIYGSIWGNRWLLDYLVATFQPKGNFTPAGQAYTKAESDARYIQSMRLGSAISTTWWENGGDCPAGNILTGGDFNSDKSYVRYKPVQVLINGQWVTISG